MLDSLKKEYDVLVVGAGPAGSSVARFCAKSGLSVLVVEKRQEIGSPKRCGEGLSKSAVERMGIDVKESWKMNTIRGARAFSPDGNYVEVDFKGPEGWVIERKVFDKYLATLAAGEGAKIVTKTEAICFRRKGGRAEVKIKSRGETFEIDTDVVVACDGVESRMARMAGINTLLSLDNVCSCVQYEMSGVDIDPDMLELYFGKDVAPGGYVWIFPKGKGIANVGIGVRKPFARTTALEYLDRFVKKNEKVRSGSVMEVNGGGVPVGGFLEKMSGDNVLVVGDSAHQVNPIHGGGISEAYVAGRIAAEVIIKAKERSDFSARVLSEYDKTWEKERGKKLKKILKLRKVVEELPDGELDWLAGYLKGEQLVDLARASGFRKLGFVLMKKPKLVGIARKLL